MTGTCECVGLLGPALGGGHGLLQGKYGLLADQIVSARVVLANGTVVTASASQHPDLLWALKGAGHNFGIVSEVTYRIYDSDSGASENPWVYELSFFSHDKLEAFYALMNDMMVSQPPIVMNFAYMMRNVDLDPEHVCTCILHIRVPSLQDSSLTISMSQAIILHILLYAGQVALGQAYASPIRALKPLNTISGTSTFGDLTKLLQTSLDSPACQRDMSGLRFPVYLQAHNTTALRDLYNYFDETMRREPRFNTSFFILEGYSMQRVQAVEESSTAFAYRGQNLL